MSGGWREDENPVGYDPEDFDGLDASQLPDRLLAEFFVEQIEKLEKPSVPLHQILTFLLTRVMFGGD